MTIGELRSIAEGLAKRANLAADGKQDTLARGWTALEHLYSYANTTIALIKSSLDGELETWENIGRLATAIVIACDESRQSTGGI